MAKKIVSVLLLIMSISVCDGLASPQASRRIQFAKGQTSVVVRGTTGNYGANYVVSGKSGQKLIFKLAPIAGIGIKVEREGPNGRMVLLEEEKGGTYEVGLEESGDCEILIGSTGKSPVSFTLTVKIAKLTDI
jgi:hypothetical protein